MSGKDACPPLTDGGIYRTMLGSLYHGDIIRAFTRVVPDCYVRDYRPEIGKSGWLNICRGYKRTTDYSTGHTWVVPAETLCVLPKGAVQAPSIFRGAELLRPGWRLEMRGAGSKLTRNQRHEIERELRCKVFGGV